MLLRAKLAQIHTLASNLETNAFSDELALSEVIYNVRIKATKLVSMIRELESELGGA